jgi:hypothetical protein
MGYRRMHGIIYEITMQSNNLFSSKKELTAEQHPF